MNSQKMNSPISIRLIILFISQTAMILSLILNQDMDSLGFKISILLSLIIILLFAASRGKFWGLTSAIVFSIGRLAGKFLSGDSLLSTSRTVLTDTEFLTMTMLMIASGFLFGLYAEHFGISRSDREIIKVSQDKRLLENQLEDYSNALNKLTHKPIYDQSLRHEILNNELALRLVNLIIASVSASNLAHRYPDNKDFDLFDANQSGSVRMLFSMLTNIQPDLLMLCGLDGKILYCNDRLMTIFGYSHCNDLVGKSVFDCLVQEDADKARLNLANVISPSFSSRQTYRLSSVNGAFSKTFVHSSVVIDLTGNPLTLAVSLSKTDTEQASYRQADNSTDQWTPLGNISELYTLPVCCLSKTHEITWSSAQFATMLGKSVEQILYSDFPKLVSHKQRARFKSFMEVCQQGSYGRQAFEFHSTENRDHSFALDLYPSISENGHYMGAVLVITDVTSQKATQEALSRRLGLEKLVSKISTQFIAMKSDDLEKGIRSVLTSIGDYEGVRETQIEIYPSSRIQKGVHFIVSNQEKPNDDPIVSDQSGQDTPNQTKAISVPIIINSETMGAFRFYQHDDQSDWLKTDLELIRLIGEILINALIRKENEMEIRLNENRLLTTLHSIGDAVIATDTDNQVILINQTAEKLTGWAIRDAINKPLDHVFNPDSILTASDTELDSVPEDDENRLLCSRDGTQYYISINQNVVQDNLDNVYGHVTVFRDVTRQKLENDEIRYISYHDKLTGLYNRAFFEEEMIRLNSQRMYPITVIIGDCNGLKITNDVFGHLEGDKLLQSIAEILKKSTRKEDIVARWGGDEFAIILPKTDAETGASIRERILQMCHEAPVDPIQPSIALGSATNTQNEFLPDDMQALLKLAEDRMYRHKLLEGKSVRNSILTSIERMIFEKSYETEEHAQRLNEISQQIGRAVGLSDFELEELSLLSVLHDIGKIGIPDNILQKPASLSPAEWEIMKKHAEKGYDLARSTPELSSIAEPILHHHEKWDGTGYPAGLQGDEIPKLSRIISIIDAYDVITHSRIYKDAQHKDDALMEIKRCAGTQFDPDLVELFLNIMNDS